MPRPHPACAVGLALLVGGCSLVEAPILAPGGPVALAQRDLLLRAVLVMLIVVVPVYALTAWVVWRYRAAAPRGRYRRDWRSGAVDAVTWTVPALIVAGLATQVWIHTHRLDPYRPLPGPPPLEVEVVAQDWKWLFLYPGLGVAAVNELAFPADRPLALRITSDTVMNAFSVPALGGQIYAMAGMVTRLHLAADRPGRFTGRNTQYSGDGFADQRFDAVAMTQQDFDAWVARARRAPARLDAAAYAALARPGARHPVSYYAGLEPGLFDAIVGKYAGAVPRRPSDPLQ